MCHPESGTMDKLQFNQPIQGENLLSTVAEINTTNGYPPPVVIMPQKIQCPHCPECFDTYPAFYAHEQTHPRRALLTCGECFDVFTSADDLKEHERVHITLSPLQCQYCEKILSSIPNRKTHERKHTGDARFCCRYCNKLLYNKYDHKRHERTHITKLNPFQCYICHHKYTGSNSLRLHLRQKHSDYDIDWEAVQMYIKSKCNETFQSSDDDDDVETNNVEERSKDSNSINSKQPGFEQKSSDNENDSIYNGVEAIHSANDATVNLSNDSVSQPENELEQTNNEGLRNVFQCSYCGEKLWNRNKWKEHERAHKFSDPLQCQYCNKTYSSIVVRQKHERMHTGENLFPCRYCDKQLTSSSDRVRHEGIHLREKPYQCVICKRGFNYAHGLKAHMTKQHQNANVPEEDMNSYIKNVNQKLSVSRRETLQREKMQHFLQIKKRRQGEATLNSITNSGDSTQNPSYPGQTEESVQNSTPPGQSLFRCSVCHKCFYDVIKFEEHERSHVCDNPLECQYCQKTFSSVKNRRNHELAHKGITSFPCSFCSKGFYNKTDLKRHERIHTGEKPYPCNICSRHFTDLHTLKKHMLAIHKDAGLNKGIVNLYLNKVKTMVKQQEKEKMLSAPQPPAQKEIVAESNDSKVFARKLICPTCGQGYINPEIFYEHKRSHVLSNPLECQFCHKLLCSSQKRRVHEKGHTGEYEFACSYCSKKIAFISDLLRHERIHTGEKPFHCVVCNTSFQDANSLKRHIKTVHKELNVDMAKVNAYIDQKNSEFKAEYMKLKETRRINGNKVSTEIAEDSQSTPDNSNMLVKQEQTHNALGDIVLADQNSLSNHTINSEYSSSNQCSNQSIAFSFEEISHKDTMVHKQSNSIKLEPDINPQTNNEEKRCPISENNTSIVKTNASSNVISSNRELNVDEPSINARDDLEDMSRDLTSDLESDDVEDGDYFESDSEGASESRVEESICTDSNSASATSGQTNNSVEASAKSDKNIKLENENGQTSPGAPVENAIRPILNLFICQHCNAKFTSRLKWQEHERAHVFENPNECQYCSKILSGPMARMKHERWHLGQEPYKCGFCPKRFNSNNERLRHERGHTGERPYMCPLCNRGFGAGASLKNHLKNVHRHQHVDFNMVNAYIKKKNRELGERLKEAKYKANKQKMIHSPAHSKKGQITQRASQSDLTVKITPLQLETPPRTDGLFNMFICSHCEAKFTSKNKWKEHERAHVIENPLECQYCNKILSSVNCRQIHERSHTGEFAHTCKICGKGFHCATTHERHMKAHTGEKEYECHLCSERFVLKSSLVKHLHKHHEDSTIEANSGRSYSNEIHPLNISSGDQQYNEIDFTHQLLMEVDSLNSHTMELIEEKKDPSLSKSKVIGAPKETHKKGNEPRTQKANCYECRYCYRTFASFPSCRIHEMRHNVEKPLACSYCSKTFRNQTSLQRHEANHKKSKPLKCKFCSKYLSSLTSLKAHEIRHVAHNKMRKHKSNLYKHAQQPKQAQLDDVITTSDDDTDSYEIDENRSASTAIPKKKGDDSLVVSGTNTFTVLKSVSSASKCDPVKTPSKHSKCDPVITPSNHSTLETEADFIELEMESDNEEYGMYEDSIDTTLNVTKNVDTTVSEAGASHKVGRGIYKCDRCNECLATKKALKEHIRWHDNFFKCSFCEDVFSDEVLAKVHEKTHGRMNLELSENVGDLTELTEITEAVKSSMGEVISSALLTAEGQSHRSRGHLTYECFVCKEVCKTKELLMKHVESHSGEKQHRCHQCDAAFHLFDSLREHELIHESKMNIGVEKSDLYKCPKCDLCFDSKDKLSVHEQIHISSTAAESNSYDNEENIRTQETSPSKNKENQDVKNVIVNGMSDGNVEKNRADKEKSENNQSSGNIQDDTDGQRSDSKTLIKSRPNQANSTICTVCGIKFKSYDQCRLHKLNEHNIEEDPESFVQCTHCGKTFSNKNKLSHHEKLHTAEKTFSCAYCDMKFYTQRLLETHTRKHTGEKPFQCKYCFKRFKNKYRAKTHERYHTGEKPYKCKYCEETFYDGQQKRVHEKKVHLGIDLNKSYTCDICGKSFACKGYLKTHRRIHTGEKPFKCDVCGKRSNTPHELKVHKRTHSDEKPHQCKYCGSCFKHAAVCRAHERTHTGERPYKCDVCEKSFGRPGTLKNHKRTHTNERPYACTYCDKAFRNSNMLVRHKRSHTGERPFPCRYCEKRFQVSSDRKRHERLHTGEKPYPCRFCDMRFTLSATRRGHEKTHQGETPREEIAGETT